MGKKPALSLRKPPAPVDLAVVERFVRSAEAGYVTQTSERLDVRTLEGMRGVNEPVAGLPAGRLDVQRSVSKLPPPTTAAPRGVLARKDGRELRRMTLYLPNELARRLAVYCAEHDLEMSDVVTAAVRVHLGE